MRESAYVEMELHIGSGSRVEGDSGSDSSRRSQLPVSLKSHTSAASMRMDVLLELLLACVFVSNDK